MDNVQCAVRTCPNNSRKTGNRIRYFRFPRDDDLLTLWTVRCDRLDTWKPSASFVCSSHFTTADYLEVTPGISRLHPEAVPSRNLGFDWDSEDQADVMMMEEDFTSEDDDNDSIARALMSMSERARALDVPASPVVSYPLTGTSPVSTYPTVSTQSDSDQVTSQRPVEEQRPQDPNVIVVTDIRKKYKPLKQVDPSTLPVLSTPKKRNKKLFCCVPTCSAWKGKDKDIRNGFHYLPKELSERTKWVLAIFHDNIYCKRSRFICRRHFTTDDYLEQPQVEPVPSGWVDGDVLLWPHTKKEVRKLQRNGESLPNKHMWTSYVCLLKATGIRDYETASGIADRLCDEEMEEESAEVIDINKQNRLQRKRRAMPETAETRYNSYFLSDGPSSSSDFQASEIPEAAIDQPNNSTTVQNDAMIIDHQPSGDQSMVLLEGDLAQNLLNSIIEVKKAVERGLAEFHARCDGIEFSISQLQRNLQQLNSGRTPGIHPASSLTRWPLVSVEEVDNFESELNDEENFNRILNHFKSVIGTCLKGKSVCYRLCDMLITKEVLVRYSWTGVSRNAEGKLPFSKLRNIVNLFFHVSTHSDPTYAFTKVEDFLKNCVLKYSSSRAKIITSQVDTNYDESLSENRNTDETQ